MAPEPKYDMRVHPTAALVRSQTDGAAAHQVTFPSCDCGDFINRKGQLVEIADGTIAVTLCKHVAEGLRRIGGWNGPAEPEPERHVNLNAGAAMTVLRSASMSDEVARTLLATTTTGAPSRRPSQRGRLAEVVVYLHAGRVLLYDIEVYPVPR